MEINERIRTILTYVQGLFKSPVYLVGGAVRDIMLGLEPKDYDFCSALSTEEVKEQLKGIHRTYLIGERHGTIGFRYVDDMIEITTFRTETYKEGSRQPEVTFTDDLISDLSRRDFTINAMAINCKDFSLVDPFGGEANLKQRVLKAVGLPRLRFREDPLRIMRAIRIASKYGFRIETHTNTYIQKLAYKLLNISKERWMEEFDKMLVLEGECLEMALYRLWIFGIFKFTIPELHLQYDFEQNSDYHDFTLDVHTTKVVTAVLNDINLRWAALLHDVGKPFTITQNTKGKNNYIFHDMVGVELVNGIALRLKWSNERRKAVVDLVRNHLEHDSILKTFDDQAKKY
jgi:putative nucleotidyltransferase with HDIG domain